MRITAKIFNNTLKVQVILFHLKIGSQTIKGLIVHFPTQLMAVYYLSLISFSFDNIYMKNVKYSVHIYSDYVVYFIERRTKHR